MDLSSPRIKLTYCFLLAVLCGARPPQMDMSSHAMETQDERPPGDLPKPQRMSGIGNAHIKITASLEAQIWFDQGLNLLHDFWDYEAARAFEQSIRVDPKCAMCYWGLYKAESFYHSTAKAYAHQALDTAEKLEGHASKRERLYIEATAANKSGSQAVELWRTLVRKYPDESQAKIFLAQLVDHEECLAILRSILKDKPDDSAANHYYIHALEATDHPEQALHSAQILASLAPASGHMVHMPGHIYFRLGDYAEAEQAFMASMHVDERYMREQHVDVDDDWNYVHNLMYAVADFMEEGKLEEATQISAKLSGARGKLESTLYIYSTRDSITRVEPSLPVALRTGDWSQAIAYLKASHVPAGRPNLGFLAVQLTRFAEGMEAIEHHDLAKAEQRSLEFDAELWRRSQETKSAGVSGKKLEVLPDALLRPLVSSLSVMSLELRAALEVAQGKTSEGKKLFATAEEQEKQLGYHEPPNYIRPVAETEGAAMSGVGDWTDAKAAYERALRERPRSGFALYGIALASEGAGQADVAAKQYRDLLDAWKDADPNLAQVAHARAYLLEHAAVGIAGT